MAKAKVVQPTVDVSVITLTGLTEAAEAMKAASAKNRQVSALPAPQEGRFNGSAVEEVGMLPSFALDSSHVTRLLTDDEIKEAGKIGTQRFGRMPLRAIAYMLKNDHVLSGGKDGIIAIYTTDDLGIQCATPRLVSTAAWASIWSTAGENWDAGYLSQKMDWFAARERTGQSSQVRGERNPLGQTAVAVISLSDISGQPLSLGAYRFFFSNGMFWSLVAPLIPGHLAQKVCGEILPGQSLPNNTTELQFLAGNVALRGGVNPTVAMGGLFMNLPADVTARPELVRSILDPKLSGPERMANFRAIRDRVATVRKSGESSVADVLPEAVGAVAFTSDDNLFS